jgi:hypothetical protein
MAEEKWYSDKAVNFLIGMLQAEASIKGTITDAAAENAIKQMESRYNFELRGVVLR